MNDIRPQLRDDYLRWKDRFGNGEDPRLLITADDVLRGHYLLIDYFLTEGEPIGVFGPRDTSLLSSAIHRQCTGFSGQVKWTNTLEQCASLFYGLIKNHPFHDGNKRTALLIVLFSLLRLQRTPTAKQKGFEELARRTAANELHLYKRFSRANADSEVLFIADFLRRNTRKEDNRYYVTTYADLDRILRRYKFRLEGPHDNHVTVVQDEVVSKFLGLARKTRERRIVQIGCPRWTAQINQKALKSVLRATGLTPENGYDSQVLFKDAEPMVALIDSYRDPLRRLKDK